MGNSSTGRNYAKAGALAWVVVALSVSGCATMTEWRDTMFGTDGPEIARSTNARVASVPRTPRLAPSGPPPQTDADLKATQERLNELGYDCGKSDGLSGPRTQACIRKYQGDEGLIETGEIDRKMRRRFELTRTPRGTDASSANN